MLCALPGLHSGPFRAPGAPRVTTHQAGEAQCLGRQAVLPHRATERRLVGIARLHNPPCMALPCCPPFAQGGLRSAATPILRCRAGQSNQGWLCPLGKDCTLAPTGVGSPAPEHRSKQRIQPSASFGSSVTLGPATGPLPRWVPCRDGHTALPRWVIEPGIKQKIPPGWEVFFVVCFARIALWLLPAEPEHQGLQRIKPGRVWPWRLATTKFGPPGR